MLNYNYAQRAMTVRLTGVRYSGIAVSGGPQVVFISLFLLGLFVCCVSKVHAVEVAGLSIPESLETGESALVLNGAGIRKRAVIKVYVGALYLQSTSGDAESIISADEPMAIRLHFRSGLVDRNNVVSAIEKGFTRSTGKNTAPIQEKIDQLIDMIDPELGKNDVLLLVYDPATGITLSKNQEVAGRIEGLAFKRALFGIWLSDAPVQESLKAAMLGK